LSQSFNAKVYPNPSSGRVNVEVTGSANTTVRIFNVTGIDVYKKTNLVDFPIHIDLSDNISGMYFVEISNKKQTILKKLILKK
jgi:GH25 family lysozyme M1 (1,4-beta-N-acetylmuramidase)